MNREDAIKKIRKCMAMAQGASGVEAAAALRQAQALMAQHQLDEQGVQLASVKEASVKAQLQPIVNWEANLANLVADGFGCELISKGGEEYKPGQGWKSARKWVYIGVDAAPEVAVYAFDVLATQCVKARRAHMAEQSKNCKPKTRTARGDAFALAWVRAVHALVQSFATGEAHAELLKAHMAKQYPTLASAKIKHRDQRRNVGDSAAHGFEAGKNARLHRGVGGIEERRLLPSPGGPT